MANNIVVVGGGVSGLTCALLLAKSKANTVTVVAKHMPGDYDIEYASPIAGANVVPMLEKENSRWEKRTWPELRRLTVGVPEAGIHFQKTRLLRRHKDETGEGTRKGSQFSRQPWFTTMFDDYRELQPHEVPETHDSGCEYTGACVNVAIYLPWLLGQCAKSGVVFKRAVLTNIADAKTMSHTGKPATFIINATGLGSYSLGGVEDKTMTPARGQVVLVRNESTPMMASSGTEEGIPDNMYLMQRAVGGGTILGGTYDMGNWDPEPDMDIAQRIMQRIVNARPDIAEGKGVEGLSVIRHAVGLRPYRKGGVRIEEERLDEETWIVHNYGHAGWGYQGSYGCAEMVVELVNKIRKEKGERLDQEPKLFSWDQ